MLIDVKFERPNRFTIDENVAQLIPEIREVLFKYGAESVAVIVYLCDPLSPVLEAFEGNPDRMKIEAVRCIFKAKITPEAFYAQKGIKEAINIYREWCNTRIAKMINIQKAAVVKAYDSLDHLTKSDNPDIDALIKKLEKAPSLIKSYMNANMQMKEEMSNVKNNVKGDRILTRAEKAIREEQVGKGR